MIKIGTFYTALSCSQQMTTLQCSSCNSLSSIIMFCFENVNQYILNENGTKLPFPIVLVLVWRSLHLENLTSGVLVDQSTNSGQLVDQWTSSGLVGKQMSKSDHRQLNLGYPTHLQVLISDYKVSSFSAHLIFAVSKCKNS